jgi:hypothetical protein
MGVEIDHKENKVKIFRSTIFPKIKKPVNQ